MRRLTDEMADDPGGIDEERRRLEAQGLDRDDLDDDPVVMLRRWFDHAVRVGVHQPEAMVVATATPAGLPASRLVLCKGFDQRGVVFYSNEQSRKGRELRANPVASGLFGWHQISRQVRFTGSVERVSEEEADLYFGTRPRGSQIGAWASPQSQVIVDRADLEERWADQERRWHGRDVRRPPHWGGYRVRPRTIEFWQGRSDRLHDRLSYRRRDDGAWLMERLAP